MSKNQNENRFLTPVFRVSYPSVFSPKAFQQADGTKGKAKYELTCIFDKDAIEKDPEQKHRWEAIVKAVKKKALDEFGVNGKIPKTVKLPFRDGDEREGTDGYNENKIFFRATSEIRPDVVGRDPSRQLTQDEFYGGCYAHCYIRIFTYNVHVNKGVSFGLGNIQKLQEGEPFGAGKTKAEDDFDALTDNESAGSTDINTQLFGG